MFESSQFWVGSAQKVKVSQEDLTPVLDIIFHLSSMAAVHKHSTMRNTGLAVLANMGYLQPQKVIPFVLKTLEDALQCDDAVHRLPTAVRILAGTIIL